jgi:hypothetical protein
MTPANHPAGGPFLEFTGPPAQKAPPSKRRRLLIGLLAAQLLLLFLVFPLLFVYVENREPPAEPEAAEELNRLPPTYSFIDGLYWSLITPIPLGSDPAWPQTAAGKALVRLSDATKLLAIGTGAGLLYETILRQKKQKQARMQYLRRGRPEDEAFPGHETGPPGQGGRLSPRDKSLREIVSRLAAILMDRDERRNGH